MLLSRVSRGFAVIIKYDSLKIAIHLLRSSREYRRQTYASEGSKKRLFGLKICLFETFKDSGPFVKTRDLFLTIKQANFYVVSKFCVESLSRKFAVFLIAYTVSQLLMHILIHWLTP